MATKEQIEEDDQIIQEEEDNDDTIAFRKLPRGDIFTDYKQDDTPEKYDFLKARSIFRFPFTLTSIKWGLVLGTLFGLHTYFKKKKASDALYWFVMGSVCTGFPIWGFFMLKYSFYTLSIRKFERDQIEQAEESNLMRDYYVKKLKLDKDISDEDLLKEIQKKQQEIYEKYSQADEIEDDPELFAELEQERVEDLPVKVSPPSN